jgi:hypothetical protein
VLGEHRVHRVVGSIGLLGLGPRSRPALPQARHAGNDHLRSGLIPADDPPGGSPGAAALLITLPTTDVAALTAAYDYHGPPP